MSEEYIPAIITASLALLAAVLAQLLGHWLNKRRKDIQFNKEIYQFLIAPNLSEVILYYETERNFKKNHDVEKTIEIEYILDNIYNQVQYADTQLLQCFFNLDSSNHFYSARGEEKERAQLYLLLWYMEYARKVIKNLPKGKNKEMINKVEEYEKLYGIWYILSDMVGYKLSKDFMSYDFYYSSFVKEHVKLDELIKLVDQFLITDERRTFILWMINNIEYKDQGATMQYPFDKTKELINT